MEEEWTEFVVLYFGDHQVAPYRTARDLLRQSPLSGKFLNPRDANDIINFCRELREEPDLQPGAPPLWWLVLGTLDDEPLRVVQDIQALHLDLKDIKIDDKGKIITSGFNSYISYAQEDNFHPGMDRIEFREANTHWITHFAEVFTKSVNKQKEQNRKFGTDHKLVDFLKERFPLDQPDNEPERRLRNNILKLLLPKVAPEGQSEDQPDWLKVYESMMQPILAGVDHYLLILSPAYFQSPVCQREFQIILQEVENHREKSLIIIEHCPIVDKSAILENDSSARGKDLPHRLWQLHDAWFPFWHQESGEFLPLAFKIDQGGSSIPDVFASVLDQVASFCLEGNVDKVKRVFLAEVPLSLEPRRQQLRRELTARGHQVFPLRSLDPNNLVADAQTATGGLVSTDLYIQLTPHDLTTASEGESQLIMTQYNAANPAGDRDILIWQADTPPANWIPASWTGNQECISGAIRIVEVASRADELLNRLLTVPSQPEIIFVIEEQDKPLLPAKLLQAALPAEHICIIQGNEDWDKLRSFLIDCREIYTIYVNQRNSRLWAEDWLKNSKPFLRELDRIRIQNKPSGITKKIIMIEPPGNIPQPNEGKIRIWGVENTPVQDLARVTRTDNDRLGYILFKQPT